jgi:hypothetical protein
MLQRTKQGKQGEARLFGHADVQRKVRERQPVTLVLAISSALFPSSSPREKYEECFLLEGYRFM